MLSLPAEAHREARKLPAETHVDEIVADRTFQFTPPEMKVHFTKMDLRGTRKEADAGDMATYTSIVVANVPRTNDQCFPPDPVATHLEMFAQAQVKGNKKNMLANDPRQHIDSVTLTSKDPKNPFSVLVDGKIFGKFFQVGVSLWTYRVSNMF